MDSLREKIKRKPLSEEHKEKIRLSCLGKNIGKCRPDLSEYNRRRKGVFKHSQETRRKISLSGKKIWTKEKRKQHSETLKVSWQNEILIKEASIRNSGERNYFYGKHFKLEQHPNWRGGKSFEIYPLGWNRTFKEQIRYRDGYKCQICGKPEVESYRKLDVHHIDYNKKNIKDKNLITLCQSCHFKTNFRRKYWETLLCNRITLGKYQKDCC